MSYHVDLLHSTTISKNYSTITNYSTTPITTITKNNDSLLTDPNLYALNNRRKSNCNNSNNNNNGVVQPQQQQPPPTVIIKNNQLVSTNRLAYVEALVDINAVVVESIWNNHTKSSTRVSPVVPLRTFIQEVLKRSRTTYSTLQTALFYLFRARPNLLHHLSFSSNKCNNNNAYISCGRRMFLASLIIASKFVQDKTYRNSAWAKIAGLPVSEINTSERYFLNMLEYQLYIDQNIFDHWHKLLHLKTQARMHHIPTFFIDLSSCSFQPISSLSSSSSSSSIALLLSYPITTTTTTLLPPPPTPAPAPKKTTTYNYQLSLLLSPPQQQQQNTTTTYHSYYNTSTITTTTTTTTTTPPPPPPLYYSSSHSSPCSSTSSYLNNNKDVCPIGSPQILPPALTSLPSSISSSPASTPTSSLSPVKSGGKRKHQNRDHVAILDKKHCRFWQ